MLALLELLGELSWARLSLQAFVRASCICGGQCGVYELAVLLEGTIREFPTLGALLGPDYKGILPLGSLCWGSPTFANPHIIHSKHHIHGFLVATRASWSHPASSVCRAKCHVAASCSFASSASKQGCKDLQLRLASDSFFDKSVVVHESVFSPASAWP